MERFETIFTRAAHRHGGEDQLKETIARNAYHYDTNPKTDDRWLAELTKRVFQAGFNWDVVENKWEGFEAAFWNFNIERCARIDMDDMERLTSDKRIVRNASKIKSVKLNAEMIIAMRNEAGSADKFIRDWPSHDFIGLMDYINRHGSRLGANTTGYALRLSGVPSFILTKDVTAALKHAGIIDKSTSSKSAKRAIQAAFNQWMEESGRDLSYVSKILALSIDG